ncbi:MAG: hypothetical protein KAT65_07240 [Methanophagales archaeon]|nr:hypothetical protein [Methanophagales archaeon]
MKNIKVAAIFTCLLLLTIVTATSIAQAGEWIEEKSDLTEEPAPRGLALDHLEETMDKYHSEFDVYTDLSAAGNHFVMLARMGKDTEINPGCFEKPHSGATCIENKFNGVGNSWGGWYLMNGVLEGEEIKPKSNWGECPNAGFNLTGATKFTFWAKGKEGGECVEFFAFGVGRNPDTDAPNAPYPDSSPKKSLGYKTLSNEWQQYIIYLSGVDLSYVLGGFGWVTKAPKNNNRAITFYLDDIKYDKERLDEPRFLVSFELRPTDVPVLKNTAYPYDNALALLSFLANHTEDDLERAKLIGDAFVYAIEHDRYFTDGRLRNGYQGGDLKLFPGWKPHGKEDTVRMPGWDDTTNHTWYEDRFCVSTHTGNVAWPIIALLSLYEETREDAYLNASTRLCEWIEDKCRDERGDGGYTGGYEGWEKTANNPQGQTKIPWKSTEHNIDVYVAFSRLYKLTGDEIWKERALHAKHFVEAMWDDNEVHFWTGTKENGSTINKDNIPADTNAWGLMAMDETDKYEGGIEWVENNCYVEADGFKGFDFNNDTDGIWFEGTAHMVIAYQILGDEIKANMYLDELRKAQKEANNTNGNGIVAASHDGVSTGFDWIYNARLHVGATAWFVFAETGYNPYWNIPSWIYVFDTDTPDNPYPSRSGTHNGTITPSYELNVTKMYTYPCESTGGHTEYVAFYNATTGEEIANGTRNGYQGDYHCIEFDKFFMLHGTETYNYTIKTGSSPQIHHTDNLSTPAGFITCSEFRDANERRHEGWIPAIRLGVK